MSQDAFKSAVERARAVAAKLSLTANSNPCSDNSNNPPSNSERLPISNGEQHRAVTNSSYTNKRPYEEEDSIVGSLKKMAYSGMGPSSNGAPVRERPTNGNTVFKPTQIYLEGIIHNGEKTLDIMLPGNKVGYVIGKGGEMIRNLQERADVKMTVVQQSSEVTDGQKQLRIIGEPSKVDYAASLVSEMLVDKDPDGQNRFKVRPAQEFGAGMHTIELPVSPQFIGLVIGKGGENIKRIAQETGAKLQVDTTKSDNAGNKLCQISSVNITSVNMAADMVKQILDNAANGRPTGPHNFGPQDEVRVQVPPNKTGLVIGKGGETVKSLKQQAGCNIELDKNSKGIFVLRGSADRIAYAQQLISEKIQSPVTVISSTSASSASNAGSAYGDQYWQAAAVQNAYGYGQDPTKSVSDPNAVSDQSQDPNAAWAAYYAQYYGSQQMQMAGAGAAAGAVQGQSDLSSGNGAAALAAAPSAADVQHTTQEVAKQWAEYYRYYGMEKEAEMWEQAAKQKQ